MKKHNKLGLKKFVLRDLDQASLTKVAGGETNDNTGCNTGCVTCPGGGGYTCDDTDECCTAGLTTCDVTCGLNSADTCNGSCSGCVSCGDTEVGNCC